MKYRLSPKTIQKYTANQLANHIERVQDKFNLSQYMFDKAYGKVYKAFQGHYVFYCSLNKDNLVEELYSFYYFIDRLPAWRTQKVVEKSGVN